MTELQFVEGLVDEIITRVNQQHKTDGGARIKIYEDIGEKFTGLARALGGQKTHGVLAE